MRYLLLAILLTLVLVACGGEDAIHSEDDISFGETLRTIDFETDTTFETGYFKEVSANWNNDLGLRVTVEETITQHQLGENTLDTSSIEVSVRPREEMDTVYGTMCYVDGDKNGYAFLISPEGEGAIARSDGGNLNLLGEWSAIDGATNSLTTTCDGNQLTLIANGDIISQVQDNTYPATQVAGSIVLDASTSDGMMLGDNNLMLHDLNATDTTSSRDYTATESDLSITSDGHFQIIHTSSDSSYIWAQGGEAVQNVSVEAQASPLSDFKNNLYGVMCRVTEDGAGYAFLVSSDGFGAIARTDGNSLSFIQDWVENDAIKKGQAENTIRGVCIDDYFALYVNGEFIGDAENDRYPNAGQVGLMGGVFVESDETGGDITVQFNNLTSTDAVLKN